MQSWFISLYSEIYIFVLVFFTGSNGSVKLRWTRWRETKHVENWEDRGQVCSVELPPGTPRTQWAEGATLLIGNSIWGASLSYNYLILLHNYYHHDNRIGMHTIMGQNFIKVRMSKFTTEEPAFFINWPLAIALYYSPQRTSKTPNTFINARDTTSTVFSYEANC